jgi:hypothetical protein
MKHPAPDATEVPRSHAPRANAPPDAPCRGTTTELSAHRANPQRPKLTSPTCIVGTACASQAAVSSFPSSAWERSPPTLRVVSPQPSLCPPSGRAAPKTRVPHVHRGDTKREPSQPLRSVLLYSYSYSYSYSCSYSYSHSYSHSVTLSSPPSPCSPVPASSSSFSPSSTRSLACSDIPAQDEPG